MNTGLWVIMCYYYLVVFRLHSVLHPQGKLEFAYITLYLLT
jgi:hypothetical protein